MSNKQFLLGKTTVDDFSAKSFSLYIKPPFGSDLPHNRVLRAVSPLVSSSALHPKYPSTLVPSLDTVSSFGSGSRKDAVVE